MSYGQKLQRYKCNQCKRTFADIPERPLEDLRIPLEKAALITHMLCEGMGIRASARLASVDKNTVLAAKLTDRQWTVADLLAV